MDALAKDSFAPQRYALTKNDFLRKYNISHAHFYNEVSRGKLRITKLGNAVRVLPEDEDAYIALCRAAVNVEAA